MKLSINIGHYEAVCGLSAAMDLCKAAGFEAMDYSLCDMVDDDCPWNGENYQSLARQTRALADAKDFSCNQTHAPFTFTEEQWDTDLFESVVLPRMIRCLEISGILGADVVVVHPIHHMEYRGHEEEIFRRNMDYYRRLIPYAKEYGVKIGVENMFQRDPLRKYIVADTCSTVEEFIRYIDTLNSPQITACLDVGHVALPASELTAADVIRALGHDRLGALHIHDNDYTRDQHLLPYLGKLDWAQIARALGEIDYQGDFTYEINGQLVYDREESFLPIGANFSGAVGKHLVSMIEENRLRK